MPDQLTPAAARMSRDTYALATPAGRLPGTAGHAAARSYVESRFTDLALKPYAPMLPDGYRHEYRSRSGIMITNLIGVIPAAQGPGPGGSPILLAAHYDSVIAAPCADDNASSVAVVLEVAARLAAQPLTCDVVVAIFDAEEPPHFLTMDMGSYRFVEEAVVELPRLAVVLDIVGHAVELPLPGSDPDLIFVAGAESDAALPALLSGVSLPTVAVNTNAVGEMSDYAAFRTAGVPFLFWSGGEWPDYHTPADTPDRVRYDKCAALADDIEAVVRRAEATGSIGAGPRDCTAFELGTFEQAVGAQTVAALAAAEGVDPTTPAGLQAIMHRLRNRIRG